MITHYSTHLQVAVMQQVSQQCASKGREEDFQQTNVDVKNTDF